jgi:hypothetical protein
MADEDNPYAHLIPAKREEESPYAHLIPQVGRAEAAARGAGAGATFGFLPHVLGGLAAGGVSQAQAYGAYDPTVDPLALARQVATEQRERQRAAREQHPGYYLGGELVGSAAMPLPGSTLLAPGRALVPRVIGGALQGGVAGGLTGASEAGTWGEVPAATARGAAFGGATGGVLGPAIPGFAHWATGYFNPQASAQALYENLARRIGGRPTRPGEMRLAAGETPWGAMPIDYLGPEGIAYAKWARNVSPTAEGTLKEALSQRTRDQIERLTQWVEDRFGASEAQLDRLGLRAEQQRQSTPAYTAAMVLGNNLPALPMFEALKQAPAVQNAMRGAAESLQNRIIGQGGATRYETHPNSLAFWDQVKRGLDSQIGRAKRAGDNELVNELTPLKQRLVGALDEMVPAYKQARGLWASFKGADNAIEAGEKFVNSRMTSTEAARLLGAMPVEQQDLFKAAARSAYLAKMGKPADTANLWTKIGENRPERQRLGLIFGQEGQNQLEAMKRVESIFHQAHSQVSGGSDTAKNLVALGLAGVGTGGLAEAEEAYRRGQGALSGAALAYLRRGRIDPRVAEHLATLLTSGEPQQLERVATIAARNPNLMDALRNVNERLTRSAGIQAEQLGPQVPLGAQP